MKKHLPFILLLTLIAQSQGFSQLICTDVSPDFSVSTSSNYSLDIDINNDLTTDFRIETTFSDFVYVAANSLGSANFVLGTGNGDTQALTLNSLIGPTSSTWMPLNSMDVPLTVPTPFGPPGGPWANAVDRYLGLKFIVGANTYYGWARFSFVTNSGDYIFKDYAYNSSPNQPIPAGQGCATASAPSFYLYNSACANYTTNVTANSGTLSASGYTWTSIPPGAVFSAPNASNTNITFPAAGTMTINLTIGTSPNPSSTTKTIQIAPSPTIHAAISPTAFCIADTPFFTLTATGAPTFTFVEISPTPFTNTVGTGTSYSDYPFLGTTTYSVAGSLNGCIAADTISILAIAPPDFSITAPTSVCPGSSATLVASSPAYNYTWTVFLGPTLAVSGTSIVVTPTVFPIDYELIGEETHGCQNGTLTTIHEKKISVLVSASASTICLHNKANLSGTGAISYSWFPSTGLNASSGQTVVASPSVTTTYTLKGAESTCTATALVTLNVDPCVGIGESVFDEDAILFYPNPAHDKLYVRTAHENGQNLNLHIYSIAGKLLDGDWQLQNQGDENYLNLEKLPVGIYMVKVSCPDRPDRFSKIIRQ